jgi:hypothetical protein
MNRYELHTRSIDAMSEGEYHTALKYKLAKRTVDEQEMSRTIVHRQPKNRLADLAFVNHEDYMKFLRPETIIALKEWRKSNGIRNTENRD